MLFILFFVSDCDLDLKGLESLGLEGDLYDLSLECERDLNLGRESGLYGDIYEDLYDER